MAKGQRLLAARRGDKLITKEELKSHVRLVQEIADLKENITRLQLQAESISATRISGAPSGSGSPDKIASNLARVDELVNYYQQKMEQALVQQKRIEDAIEGLPDKERLLMRYRYIDGMDWVDVASRMHYSWKQTHRIHGRALNLLKDI